MSCLSFIVRCRRNARSSVCQGSASTPVLCILILVAGLFLSPGIAQVMVLEPPGAAAKSNNTIIEGSTAAFGAPFYGERVEGELLFFDVNGCKAEQYSLPVVENNESSTERKSQTPLIVMLRRGGCNFVAKVKIAQSKGAKAVLVADAKGSLSTNKEIKRVIVSDDGWGESVKIPSILLSEEDANFLIAAGDGSYETPPASHADRKEGRGVKTVILELVWSLPKDHAVQVDIWTTPSSIEATKFMKEFAPFAHAFKDKIDFQPHYWVMSMARDFHEMCTDSSADFCAFDPDFGGKTTGKMVLQETVRQLCLWETTKSLHPRNPHSGFYSEFWWSYMEELPNLCPHEELEDEQRFGEKCSYKLMEKLQVNIRQVKKCYEEKFNTLLAHELVNRAWAPTAILINKSRYSGALDSELVTRAICTAFAQTQPECDNFLKNGELIMLEQSRLTEGQIFFICAGVVLSVAALCVFLFCYFVLPFMKRRLHYAEFDSTARRGEETEDSAPPTAVYPVECLSVDSHKHSNKIAQV